MINECKTQTILVGHRVTVPSSHPSPLRQLTSVTLPRRQQQSHDPTLRVSMERRSLHDSSITVARSEEQPSESKSAKLRQSLRKSTLYAVPILIWRAGFS